MQDTKGWSVTHPGGRPRHDLDFEHFKKLCALHCTKEECAGFFEISVATMERRCYEWANELGYEDGSFETLRKMYSAKTKMSLRRAQIRNAVENDNSTMQIWLGKQLLDQKDATIDPSDSVTFELPYKLD